MPEPAARAGRRPRSTFPVLGYAMAIALALLMLAPFLWMISTSLMGELEVFQFPPRLLPARAQWSNYPKALTALPFATYFRNSIMLAAATVLGQVTTGAMAGYAFARYRFVGRDSAFVMYLAMLMVPGIVLLVPRFLLVDALGGVDTIAGLVSADLVAVWGVFLMRQFFLTVPRDTEDAARLDGAGEWTAFGLTKSGEGETTGGHDSDPWHSTTRIHSQPQATPRSRSGQDDRFITRDCTESTHTSKLDAPHEHSLCGEKDRQNRHEGRDSGGHLPGPVCIVNPVETGDTNLGHAEFR